MSKNKQNIILYKKLDWTNISDSLRRLVFDLTTKEPSERLSLNQLMSHTWLKPHFKEISDGNEEKKEKKPKKMNSEGFNEKVTVKKYGSEGNSNRNLRVSGGNTQNFNSFALNSVNSLFIQTGATSENSYCLLSPAKSFNSSMDSPSKIPHFFSYKIGFF